MPHYFCWLWKFSIVVRLSLASCCDLFVRNLKMVHDCKFWITLERLWRWRPLQTRRYVMLLSYHCPPHYFCRLWKFSIVARLSLASCCDLFVRNRCNFESRSTTVIVVITVTVDISEFETDESRTCCMTSFSNFSYIFCYISKPSCAGTDCIIGEETERELLRLLLSTSF